MLAADKRRTLVALTEKGAGLSQQIRVQCADVDAAIQGLIDESALLWSLENKAIAGAAVDVMEADSPDHPGLMSCKGDNLIFSPHIAFASQQSIVGNTDKIMENINHFIEGSPINVVN